jgi:hypothetical protein
MDGQQDADGGQDDEQRGQEGTQGRRRNLGRARGDDGVPCRPPAISSCVGDERWPVG